MPLLFTSALAGNFPLSGLCVIVTTVEKGDVADYTCETLTIPFRKVSLTSYSDELSLEKLLDITRRTFKEPEYR